MNGSMAWWQQVIFPTIRASLCTQSLLNISLYLLKVCTAPPLEKEEKDYERRNNEEKKKKKKTTRKKRGKNNNTLSKLIKL